MSQRPMVLGLLVCEQVIVEAATHNVTLVNCFTSMKVEQFPSEARRFTIFAALAGALGDVPLAVQVNRLDTLEAVFRQTQIVRFPDKLREVRFIFRVSRCSFPVAGAYEATLAADGEPLASHKFHVW
ncbi:MAG TPA: hypothetical protein VMS17_26370 [Gemmataceae bacterium]|nr:hypothetical protein [Gemmataceae bacterium]